MQMRMQSGLNRWLLYQLLKSLMLIVICYDARQAFADIRFEPKFNYINTNRICLSKGARKIEGFSNIEVTAACWEWEYDKVVSYPSADDCKQYRQCYFANDLECLLNDSLGNCVNRKKSFTCEAWVPVITERETARMGLTEKDGRDDVLCEGIPCIDGNCVDKSYLTNGEMMDSVSKLYAISKMNPDKMGNFNLFQGSGLHCSKKPTDYTNCCKKGGKGWGTNLGAKCSPEENRLATARSKNLCVDVGTEEKGGVVKISKQYYCCFSNMLDKVIQVQGRKQLGKGFGSPGAPDCSGLTLDDIQKIDWEKVDFTEFIEELKVNFAGKYKAPDPKAIGQKIKGSNDNIREYDVKASDKDNNSAGWRKDLHD